MVWILGLAAFVGAVISGITGIGGGTLLIAMMFAVGLTPVLAVPLHAAVQLVANGSRAVVYRQDIHWASAAWFFLSGAPLPFLTVAWAAQANEDGIRLALATAILVSLVPHARTALGQGWSLRRKMLVAGCLNGAVGMFIGATGLVIGPFFIDARWSKETTVGTLALCQSLGHGLKIVAFGSVGFGLIAQWRLLLPLMLAVALGTVLGRYLMRRLSAQQFSVLFRAILLLLALRLGATGLMGLLA
jgi:uncharacterized membrane protein YfcA